jgi:hypothetical protein
MNHRREKMMLDAKIELGHGHNGLSLVVMNVETGNCAMIHIPQVIYGERNPELTTLESVFSGIWGDEDE